MPSPLTDHLERALTAALARQPDDAARVIFLIKQFGSWTERYRRFAWTGAQPFGCAHPEYGSMTAGDFLIVLGMIGGAKAAIERRMENAEAVA